MEDQIQVSPPATVTANEMVSTSDDSGSEASSDSGSGCTVQDETVQVGVYQLFSNSNHYDQKAIINMVTQIITQETNIISAYVLYDTVVLVANKGFDNNWAVVRPRMLKIIENAYWIKVTESRDNVDREEFNRLIKRLDKRVYNKMLARLCSYHYSPVDIRGVTQLERRQMLLTCGYGYTDFTPVVIKSVEGIYVTRRDIDTLVDPSHIMCSDSLRSQLKYDDLQESNDITDKLLIGSALVLAAYLSVLVYAANML